jgi:hypothetical protein
MADPLYHVGAQGQCPHGASIATASSNIRVKVSAMAVATMADLSTVAGCPFQIPVGAGTKPQPCVKVQWLKPALRVRVMGQPALLKTSAGLCQSVEQIPQGPPTITVTQPRVKGT